MTRATMTAMALALAAPAAAEAVAPTFATPFQDHAVLQRDRPAAVWGTAAPGARVTVALDGWRTTARADAAGRWQARLPAHAAGGPFALTATADGATVRREDVMVGDVFLCSGQSNMELEVRKALDPDGTIGAADDAGLRLLHVEKLTGARPRDALGPASVWTAASPATVPDFAAACYFMGRELRKTQKVPIGLIEAAWGGSTIESWMSPEALARFGGFDRELALVQRQATDPQGAALAWTPVWQEWWHTTGEAKQGRPWADARSAQPWKPVPAMTRWQQWGDRAIEDYHGSLWYRAEVRLTAAQARRAATLSLGPIDEEDHAWVNGRPVGGGTERGAARRYPLPAGTLRAGVNTVVVNVFDGWTGGGIHGPDAGRAIEFADGSRVSLAKGWSWLRPPAGAEWTPRPPWGALSGYGTIGNGMIAPLAPYTLRGVAWYQGESNVYEAERYERLLAAWMADWRARFDDPALPFLLVQLTAFNAPAIDRPTDDGWGRLRDAQRRAAAADPRAAIVATQDLGSRWDVHPSDKLRVGLRLAQAARPLVYGEKGVAAGALPVSARRTADGVAVRFAGAMGGLHTYGAARAIGFELCGADGPCRFADAAVTAPDTVTLTAADPAATRVRFCWADYAVCNVHDDDGVPPVTFELPVTR